MLRFGVALVVLVGCLPEVDSGDKDSASCGTIEVPYDGLDNDCDPSTPDDDLDGDGFPTATDCNDDDAAIHPDATEICDPLGQDENCNELANDDDPTVSDASDWYRDDDGDEFGRADDRLVRCEQPDGYVDDDRDCDDTEALVNPDADEICDGQGWDDDCNGLADQDDPGLIGDLQTYWVDTDDDGYGVDGTENLSACSPPDGYSVAGQQDCAPGNPLVNPGMDELCDSMNVDEDCNGVANDAAAVDAVDYYQDSDGDGYGVAGASQRSCTPLPNSSPTSNDCDDGNELIHPDQTERCDNIDWNCDTVDAEPGLVTAWGLSTSLPLTVSTAPGTSTQLDLTTALRTYDRITFCGGATYYVEIRTDRSFTFEGYPLQGQLPELDGSGTHSVLFIEQLLNTGATVELNEVVVQNGEGTSTLTSWPVEITDSGGGIACNAIADVIFGVQANTELLINDSVIRDNHASGRGGGLATRGCYVTAIRTTFESNTATSGAGIFAQYAEVNVLSSILQDNTANGTADGEGGGGVHLEGAQLDCAAFPRGAAPTVFHRNSTRTNYGGAIVMDYYSDMSALGCDFGDSTANDNPGYDIGGINTCDYSDLACSVNWDFPGWNVFEFGANEDAYCSGEQWFLQTLLTGTLLGAPIQYGVDCGGLL